MREMYQERLDDAAMALGKRLEQGGYVVRKGALEKAATRRLVRKGRTLLLVLKAEAR